MSGAAGASPLFPGATGTAWHIPLSDHSSLQPELCLSWCYFSNQKWHLLPGAILCNIFSESLSQETRAASDGPRLLEDGRSHCFCLCPECFRIFLCLFQKRIVTSPCCSLCSCTQQLVFQGFAEPAWLCLGHHHSKSSVANVTFPGIMLQCCCSSFRTQILSNAGREKKKRLNMFLC